MGRLSLTLVMTADRGISPGQSITVAALSSADRAIDLSSKTSLNAVLSVAWWKIWGVEGVGEMTSKA